MATRAPVMVILVPECERGIQKALEAHICSQAATPTEKAGPRLIQSSLVTTCIRLLRLSSPEVQPSPGLTGMGP